MMLYGRGWFKSRHPLELVLHDGAKQDGCVLDLQAASSHATISEQRGTPAMLVRMSYWLPV